MWGQMQGQGADGLGGTEHQGRLRRPTIRPQVLLPHLLPERSVIQGDLGEFCGAGEGVHG